MRTKTRAGRVLLVIAGFAHLVPATTIVSRDRLEAAYAISVSDPAVELLLRHRATFFGLTGMGLIAGAAIPRYQLVSTINAVVSLGSFVKLAQAVDEPTARLKQVARLDVFLIVALGAASLFTARGEPQS